MRARPQTIESWAALAAAVLLGAATPALHASSRSGAKAWCGTSLNGARDAVWEHRERLQRQGPRALAGRGDSQDVGEIAVLVDQGDLALLRNPMDLQGAALRFSPAGDGYSVLRLSLPLAEAGTRLPLGDDASRLVPLPFAFPFFGTSYSEVYVNSDGNLSFGEGDSASIARNMGRLVGGPPRTAPLLADFDPTSGGSVTTRSEGDRFLVMWSSVPQWDKTDKNTFQVALYADGRIDFVYGSELSTAIEEGAVGIAPGAERGGLLGLDLSAAGGESGAGAIAESFRSSDTLDVVAVARRFYAEHGDDYRQLIIFTNRRLMRSGTFAYEQTLGNEVAGIGDAIFDLSSVYGSGGRLQSVAAMDDVGKYPDDPERKFLGEDSALGVLGHEVGHRWLARALFRDGEISSRELLGRDEVHWSFFMDSDASHVEGNDIEDLGGGQFQTVAAGIRYGPLDQYLMGVRPPEEVPPFFVVRQPSGTGDVDPGRDPQAGVRFSGLRRNVTVEEVIAALGPRNPAPAPQPEPWRQAFILVGVGGAPTAEQIAKVEKLRAAWEGYFQRSTDGRFAVDPRLD